MRVSSNAIALSLIQIVHGFVDKMELSRFVTRATRCTRLRRPDKSAERCGRAALVSPEHPYSYTRYSHSSPSISAFHTDGESDGLVDSTSLASSRIGLDPRSNRFHAPVVYHEGYSFDGWPKSHTFPMDKFAAIARALQTTTRETHPSTSPLPRPVIRTETDFFRPIDANTLLSTHRWWFDIICPDFLNRFLAGRLTVEECRRIGFREQTSRPELIERTILEVAGTVLTCQLAVQYGIASNAAGGTHHAHLTMGAGYTILNDLAVATHVLTTLHPDRIKRVLVVDCDVHQGDGTAQFHAPGAPLKDKLFTLSLHCATNYPTLKANSTIDVGLPDGMEDDEYLEVLRSSVEDAFCTVEPDLVLYDAGVDVYADDRLGRLRLSERGIRLRDRFVVDYCAVRGIPVATVVGGGYDRDVDALGRRHALVIEEAAYVWRKHNLWKRGDRNVQLATTYE